MRIGINLSIVTLSSIEDFAAVVIHAGSGGTIPTMDFSVINNSQYICIAGL